MFRFGRPKSQHAQDVVEECHALEPPINDLGLRQVRSNGEQRQSEHRQNDYQRVSQSLKVSVGTHKFAEGLESSGL